MKVGFSRQQALKPPKEVKPKQIELLAALKVGVPENKPWWLVVVAIFAIGLVLGIVGISFASGARTFNGVGSFFPILMVISVLAMLFGGRFGGSQQMSRGRMDALRGQFMLQLDGLRKTAGEAADALDSNYRWYHPPVETLEAAVGGPRMWERSPGGRDSWFGVLRVGVGMTALDQAGAVSFSEPADMPTDIEMEPATGVALQEFVRTQQVAYGTPALISLLVEPGWCLDGDGDHERVLALTRAMLCQLAFSHGPDHLNVIVVTDDVDEWDWVKWLPHVADNEVADAAGGLRMVYGSVQEFYEAQHSAVLRNRGGFQPRHGAAKDPVTPMPHTVIVSDVSAGRDWTALVPPEGVEGVTFFDLRGGVPTCVAPQRLLRLNSSGIIEAVPRDLNTWAPEPDEQPVFFARADQMSRDDAESLAQTMARFKLAESYEMIGNGAQLVKGPARDVLTYWGIDDPANIDFHELWGQHGNITSRERLRIPFGNRADTGELLLLDIKDMAEGGDGPHGVMSGTTGSGKTTSLRALLLSAMLGHPPENLQMVLADCKGGQGVKPFEGTPHVAHVITDLEDDQTLLSRFVDGMFGEIARRKQMCNDAGVDDALQYNKKRSEQARTGAPVLEPMPVLFFVIDEFKEAFSMNPELVLAVDQVCRQGRSYWIHLLMASQDIDSKAEKLLENVGYRLVLAAKTAASAAAAGVPKAVHLNKVGQGYLRLGPAEDLTKFQFEFLWRDYRKPGTASEDDAVEIGASTPDYFEPQLFTATPVLADDTGPQPMAPTAETEQLPAAAVHSDDDDDDVLRMPTVGGVIIDQLRAIDFTPRPLFCPPLDKPRTVDDVVEMYLGRPWDEQYAATPDLQFPIGVIDRPYKQDQQPLLVNGNANAMVIGQPGSGRTTALQTLICSAAMTHTPEQVQFYVLALSGASLSTVRGLPHVGRVASLLEEDAIRRTVSEMSELLEGRRQRFLSCGLTSMDEFRERKAALSRMPAEQAAQDPLAADAFGDVYLVVDNPAALTDQASTFHGKEHLSDEITRLIREGGSYGIHVIVAVSRPAEIGVQARNLFEGRRIELKLATMDATLVKPGMAEKVPVNKPGRGMVAQNYPREGYPAVGLHTMTARPALRGSAEGVFESHGLAETVASLAGAYRPAPRVRELPAQVSLEQLRAAAETHRHAGMVWAVDEFARPVGLEKSQSPFLVITGKHECGRTTACAAVMSEIGRVYAPGSSNAVASSAEHRRAAQVWVVSPRRELLRVLGSDYVESFAYRPDDTKRLADELAAVVAARMPRAGLGVEESFERTWTGPEIFLVIDDADRLPPGYDAPLAALRDAANAADDVGLHIVYSRLFGGWSSGPRNDPLLAAMLQANADLLVMDSDASEMYIRDKWKGHPMQPGRGFLMGTDGSRSYVQVGQVPLGKQNR